MNVITLFFAVISLAVAFATALGASLQVYVRSGIQPVQAAANLCRALVGRVNAKKPAVLVDLKPELHPVFLESRDYQVLEKPTFLRRNKIIAS